MAWIYFQELAGLDLHSVRGLEPLPIVKKTDTHRAFYCPECDQVTLTERPSGTTSQLCTQGSCQKLISSSGGFHAKISALQDVEQAWQESEVDFFSRLLAWSKKSHPNSSFWKTSQPSALEGEKPWLKLWPRSGMTVDGRLYLPQALERRTGENAGSYLPTPVAIDTGSRINRGGSQGRIGKERPTLGAMARLNLWPTSTARDHKDNNKSPAELQRNSKTLATQAGGQLNPQWVEWLMGYQIEWTALDALAIQWFRYKQEKRSKN